MVVVKGRGGDGCCCGFGPGFKLGSKLEFGLVVGEECHDAGSLLLHPGYARISRVCVHIHILMPIPMHTQIETSLLVTRTRNPRFPDPIQHFTADMRADRIGGPGEAVLEVVEEGQGFG